LHYSFEGRPRESYTKKRVIDHGIISVVLIVRSQNPVNCVLLWKAPSKDSLQAPIKKCTHKATKVKGSAHIRGMLAEFISNLTAARSHWFLINSPGVDDYDLMRLFGMTENDYYAFLLSAGLLQRDKNNTL
jgi:hypothetical protein